MAPTITQDGSFRTKSPDASPPSQVEGNAQSQCRPFATTPQASSFIIDSAYGSRDETIPSSSNLHPSIMLPQILPKPDHGDSGIALSSNASVLRDPAATQPQSGSAAQGVRDPIQPPCFHPPHLDPNLPSNMITQEEQNYFGFSSEGLLNSNLFESLDHHGQKST